MPLTCTTRKIDVRLGLNKLISMKTSPELFYNRVIRTKINIPESWVKTKQLCARFLHVTTEGNTIIIAGADITAEREHT